MQLDRLQLELRPRPNAQALDLGFALLAANPRVVYTTWLMLWLPLISLCGVCAIYVPHWGFFGGGWWMLVAWWLRPLIERAPLYLFSRQVFGEHPTWQQALRAWPSQCGGAWFRLLVWWRLFSAGRGLYQPIWQLEEARGAGAAVRMRAIGHRTLGSATMFGVACAYFENVLQLGLFAFIGLFLSDTELANPFAFFISNFAQPGSPWLLIVSFIAYAMAVGLIGPIYVACCFTLYLNRRATLEAWDIEIMLRQLKPMTSNSDAKISKTRLITPALMLIALILCGSTNTNLQAAENQPSKLENKEQCEQPKWAYAYQKERSPAQSEAQQALRNEVDTLYQDQDLRPFICQEVWVKTDHKPVEKADLPQLKGFALFLKYTVIFALCSFIAWLIWRYRGQIFSYGAPKKLHRASEVAGLDIRPESLPEDIAATALQLWQQGQIRAAVALLYRASLSRLVHENQLTITQGATENDSLRLAQIAHQLGEMAASRLALVEQCTKVWLNAAYAHRMPETLAEFEQLCRDWQHEFDGKPVTGVSP
ncbi:MAG: hypothetical protein K2P84_05030 [Undibacterium sp.]|nr:hypothetical protein [Undibacterium sp.]